MKQQDELTRLRRIADDLQLKVFRGPTMEAVHTKTVEWQAAESIKELLDALAAAEAKLEKARKQMQYIVPYLDWTVGRESPGYHPTMPSAVGAFKDTLKEISDD